MCYNVAVNPVPMLQFSCYNVAVIFQVYVSVGRRRMEPSGRHSYNFIKGTASCALSGVRLSIKYPASSLFGVNCETVARNFHVIMKMKLQATLPTDATA